MAGRIEEPDCARVETDAVRTQLAHSRPTAASVAAVYRDVLGLHDCAEDESFFRIGGDSFQAALVLAVLARCHGVRLPLAEMYRDSSPATVAKGLRELMDRPRPRLRRSITSLARRRRTWVPLSMSQESLYAMDRATGGAGLFNNIGRLKLCGDIDPGALRQALADTVRRQPALRTVFGEEDGRPVQRFVEQDAPQIDVCDLRAENGAALLRRCVREQHLRGFDMHAGPPVRFVLARTADREWTVLTAVHHIVFDGMSQSLLLDEIAQAYAHRVGAAPEGPAPEFTYADFAHWQRYTLRGERLEEHLRGLAEAVRHTPSPIIGDGALGKGYTSRIRPFEVEDAIVQKLRYRAAGHDTTLFVGLVATLLEFAARRVGGTRQLVAVQAANRGLPGTEDVIGCFSNTLYVSAEARPSLDPEERLTRTRDDVARALLHEEMPLDYALGLLAERGVGGACRPQIGFALQPPRHQTRELPGGVLEAEYLLQSGDTVDPTNFPFVLELFAEPRGLAGVSHHRLAVWPEGAFEVAERQLAAAFEHMTLTGRPSVTER
ncbi:condensation domain-containing protein [Streptomyces sp. NPDC088348]|uniref:condensation domain-containing protein n=1 Tax=Streptomyces sp. NPDC088348 TaxID=3365853 RepID=UPI00381AE645